MTFDDGGSIQIPASLLFEATATASFQFVCVFLVSTFIVFCCIPRLHSSVRELVRPSVLFWVERGIDWNVWAQQYKRPWLTNLFEQSSHSVSVGFYVRFESSFFQFIHATHRHYFTDITHINLCAIGGKGTLQQNDDDTNNDKFTFLFHSFSGLFPSLCHLVGSPGAGLALGRLNDSHSVRRKRNERLGVCATPSGHPLWQISPISAGLNHL